MSEINRVELGLEILNLLFDLPTMTLYDLEQVLIKRQRDIMDNDDIPDKVKFLETINGLYHKLIQINKCKVSHASTCNKCGRNKLS